MTAKRHVDPLARCVRALCDVLAELAPWPVVVEPERPGAAPAPAGAARIHLVITGDGVEVFAAAHGHPMILGGYQQVPYPAGGLDLESGAWDAALWSVRLSDAIGAAAGALPERGV